MGARRSGDDAEKIYAAAQEWINRTLLSDDSLFTPGVAIWSSERLEELSQVLDQPYHESEASGGLGGKYLANLRLRLANSGSEIHQLMSEILYVHLLIVANKKGDTKRQWIETVLGWTPSPIEIQNDVIAAGFTTGFVTPGFIFDTNKEQQIRFLIRFVERWKEESAEKQGRLQSDPWLFNYFLKSITISGGAWRLQRNALLHLVHPDIFEDIVSDPDKEKITSEFKTYVRKPTDDVDCKLHQIRQYIEPMYGSDFHFFASPVRELWNYDGDKPPLPPLPPCSTQALADDLTLPPKFLQEIETLLEDKKQVIFQGPPGTGKTFVARELAEHLAGSKDRVRLIQFHPSYSYEDFVQGYRPKTTDDGQVGYVLRDGPLIRAARQAAEAPEDKKHFLIIDEINRGNLAGVFGELYFLLEYRNESIQLQYSDDAFQLPKNLYIIGTMNTADRSIALVDLALRRRFYFVEFHPDKEPIKDVLRKWLRKKEFDDMEWVANVVDRANRLLGDDRHAAIGPSYFMKDDLDDAQVELIWKHSVFPYIEERLFGQDDRLGQFNLDALRGEVAQVEESQTDDDGETASNAENGNGGE